MSNVRKLVGHRVEMYFDITRLSSRFFCSVFGEASRPAFHRVTCNIEHILKHCVSSFEAFEQSSAMFIVRLSISRHFDGKLIDIVFSSSIWLLVCISVPVPYGPCRLELSGGT